MSQNQLVNYLKETLGVNSIFFADPYELPVTEPPAVQPLIQQQQVIDPVTPTTSNESVVKAKDTPLKTSIKTFGSPADKLIVLVNAKMTKPEFDLLGKMLKAIDVESFYALKIDAENFNKEEINQVIAQFKGQHGVCFGAGIHGFINRLDEEYQIHKPFEDEFSQLKTCNSIKWLVTHSLVDLQDLENPNLNHLKGQVWTHLKKLKTALGN